MNAAFNHRSSNNAYNSHAEASYDYGKYEADSDISLNPPRAEFNVKTPHRGFTTLNALLTHSADMNGFKSHAEASSDNKKMQADASFQKSPFEVKFAMKTPFQAVRDVNAILTHSGSMYAFQTHAEANVNDHKGEADASFTTQPFQARFSLKTPFEKARDILASFQHEGDMSGFNTKAEAGNENGKFELQANAQLRPIEIKVTLKTPIGRYEEMGFEMSHKGSLSKTFRSQASVQYQTDKTISVSAHYKNMRRVIGEVEVKTPFRGYQSIGASFRHDADKGVASSVEMNLGKESISGNVDLKLSPNPSGKVQMKTPFSGLEDISLALEHKMDESSIDSSASVTTPRGQVSVSVKGQYSDIYNMHGSFALVTPMKNLAIVASSQGTIGSIRSEATVTYDSNVVAAKVEVQNTQGLKVDAKLSTPFAGYEEMSFEMEHQGSLTDFQTSGSMRNGRQAITANVQLQTGRQMTFTTTIQTSLHSLLSGIYHR